ncbi:hypothetical protein COBT_001663 [Conglomerata obtusa]
MINDDLNYPSEEIFQKESSRIILENCLIELLITEANYYNLLLVAEIEIIYPLEGDKGYERKIAVDNMFLDIKNMIKFENEFFIKLFEICKEHENIILETFNHIKDKNLYVYKKIIENGKFNDKLYFQNIDLDHKKAYNKNYDKNNDIFHQTIKNVFNFFLDTDFEVYKTYIAYQARSTKHRFFFKNNVNFAVYLNHEYLKDIVVAPAQRVARYPLILKRITENIENVDVFQLGCKVFAKVTQITFECNLKVSEVNQFEDFIDLDKYTFFLFGRIMLVYYRYTKITNIDSIKPKDYEFYKVALCKNIDISKIATNKFKITYNDESTSNYCNAINKRKSFELPDNIETRKFLDKLLMLKNKKLVNEDINNIFIKKDKHKYIFNLANKLELADYSIRIDKEDKNFNNKYLLDIVVKDNVTIYGDSIKLIVTFDTFKKNFYTYIYNAILISSSKHQLNHEQMYLFDSNLKKLPKVNLPISIPNFITNEKITDLCEELENKIQDILESMQTPIIDPRQSMHCYTYLPSDLNNNATYYNKHELINLEKLHSDSGILLYWKESIFALSFEQIKKLNANIGRINSLSHLKKYDIDEDCPIYTLIKHFFIVYKLVLSTHSVKLLSHLFNEVDTKNIEKMCKRIANDMFN